MSDTQLSDVTGSRNLYERWCLDARYDMQRCKKVSSSLFFCFLQIPVSNRKPLAANVLTSHQGELFLL